MKSLTLFALSLFPALLSAQTYINREWVKNYGAPDTVEWSASQLDANGEVVTVGNTIVPGERANILLTKFNTDGSIKWQADWNSSRDLTDYGAAIILADSENVYVAGASQYSNDTTFDILGI